MTQQKDLFEFEWSQCVVSLLWSRKIFSFLMCIKWRKYVTTVDLSSFSLFVLHYKRKHMINNDSIYFNRCCSHFEWVMKMYVINWKYKDILRAFRNDLYLYFTNEKYQEKSFATDWNHQCITSYICTIDKNDAYCPHSFVKWLYAHGLSFPKNRLPSKKFLFRNGYFKNTNCFWRLQTLKRNGLEKLKYLAYLM